MPFSDPEKNNIKRCVSLQVTRRLEKRTLRNNKNRKRVLLFTSKGSVTVEATITISIFMLVIISISSLLVM